MAMTFEDAALADLMYWMRENRKNAERVYKLIQDIQRNGPASGLGMPERLRYISGWSRRIDKENRLLYDVENGVLHIIACKGHYED